MSASTLDRAVVFLDLIGTQELKHSTGSLMGHLIGTYALLRDWGEPDHVAFAGLYHSIYGTSQFKTCAFPTQGRGIIRGIIGTDAEQLAYEFCIADRTKFPWADLGDYKTGLEKELYTIEAANLIEQGDKPEYVARLLTVPLSEAARKAVQVYIGANNEGNSKP